MRIYDENFVFVNISSDWRERESRKVCRVFIIYKSMPVRLDFKRSAYSGAWIHFKPGRERERESAMRRNTNFRACVLNFIMQIYESPDLLRRVFAGKRSSRFNFLRTLILLEVHTTDRIAHVLSYNFDAARHCVCVYDRKKAKKEEKSRQQRTLRAAKRKT